MHSKAQQISSSLQFLATSSLKFQLSHCKSPLHGLRCACSREPQVPQSQSASARAPASPDLCEGSLLVNLSLKICAHHYTSLGFSMYSISSTDYSFSKDYEWVGQTTHQPANQCKQSSHWHCGRREIGHGASDLPGVKIQDTKEK